jgi:hypothetical protein
MLQASLNDERSFVPAWDRENVDVKAHFCGP